MQALQVALLQSDSGVNYLYRFYLAYRGEASMIYTSW